MKGAAIIHKTLQNIHGFVQHLLHNLKFLKLSNKLLDNFFEFMQAASPAAPAAAKYLAQFANTAAPIHGSPPAWHAAALNESVLLGRLASRCNLREDWLD
jgi:hypothetical protein